MKFFTPALKTGLFKNYEAYTYLVMFLRVRNIESRKENHQTQALLIFGVF